MAAVIEPLRERIERATGAHIEVLGVENTLFGPTVNTAGLLPGRDMLRAVEASGPFDDILLPAESLNDDDVFIDDLSLDEFTERFATARVTPGYELISTLAGR